MKLELKHLVPYLPYGLKVRVDYYSQHEGRIFNFSPVILLDFSRDEYIVKPILRPLSDLTREIEHNSISIKLEPELKSVIPMLLIRKYYHYTIREDGHFSYHIGDGTCIGSLYYSVPYELIQLLLEWHFDVFGLVEQDLAIDINKL